jgi:hypothetical protein
MRCAMCAGVSVGPFIISANLALGADVIEYQIHNKHLMDD